MVEIKVEEPQKGGWKNMKPEQKSGLKNLFINLGISLIILLIVGLLIYWKFYSLITPVELQQLKDFYNGMSGWGLACLLFAIAFYMTGGFLFMHYRKKYKDGETKTEVHTIIFKILLCSLAALFSVWNMFSESMFNNIYIFVLAFGLCYMFFSLFAIMKYETLSRLVSFPLTLVFRFIIPMMPIVLILLGSIQGMYPSNSTFLTDTAKVFGTDTYVEINNGGSLGMIFGYGCYKLVSTIYLLGESRPVFMFILCILSTLILLYVAIYKHFIKLIPPLSFVDNYSEAEAVRLEQLKNAKDDEEEDYKGNPNLLEIL
jgi:hypothetical protein